MSPRRSLYLDPKLITVATVLLLVLVPLAVWWLQGTRMRSRFTQALRDGAQRLPVELRNKKWTDRELAGAEVLRLPSGSGQERALSRQAHDRGRIVVSARRFSYQGTVEDEATGIVHVFGLPRDGNGAWRWVTIHPTSLGRHIERRAAALEELKARSQATTEPHP